jgi:flavin-binding protein dodecin
MKGGTMGYEGEGHADELGYKFECEPAFDGEEVEGSYFIGYSRDGLQDAFDAAVNRANKKPGTTFVVTQIEVVSEGDPHVGGYKVILTTPTG